MGLPSVYSTCEFYSYPVVPYTYYQWTQQTSGYFDILAYSQRLGASPNDFYAILYNSSAVTYLGTGNSTNPVDPCNGNENIWVSTSRDGSDVPWAKINQGHEGYSAIGWSNYQLEAGKNYTLVLTSGNSNEFYNFGFWMRPTLFGNLGNNDNFNEPQPKSSLDRDTCSLTGDTRFWNTLVFTPDHSTVLIDSSILLFSLTIDPYACLYKGNNLGASDFSTPPTSCGSNWILCQPLGYLYTPIAIQLTPGSNYTLVFSGVFSGYEYAVSIYTGTNLGPVGTTGDSSSSGLIAISIALIVSLSFF